MAEVAMPEIVMAEIVMPEMNSASNVIAPMSAAAIGQVRALEAAARTMPQQRIATSHLFHAGMYARSLEIPAGMMITGALIKIPTILIISGHVVMYVEGEARELSGYNVFAAGACRKQAFLALADSSMTMLFPTTARTVAEAEESFTDEVDLLMSRGDLCSNTITVTGD